MIEDTIRDIAEGMLGIDQKVFGVLTGTVVDVADPLALGRVRIRLPSIDDTDLTPWARVATPMTGVLAGEYFIPGIGDEVLVAFEHGDLNAPYIIGSLWNAVHLPPLPSPLMGMRVIRTPEGNQLGFRMVPPAVTLTTPDMTPAAAGLSPGITLASNVMITLQCGPTQLIMTPQGLTIIAPQVTISSSGAIVEAGSSVSVMASGKAEVVGLGSVSVTGAVVRINS